jgi:hypothetical protein
VISFTRLSSDKTSTKLLLRAAYKRVSLLFPSPPLISDPDPGLDLDESSAELLSTVGFAVGCALRWLAGGGDFTIPSSRDFFFLLFAFLAAALQKVYIK